LHGVDGGYELIIDILDVGTNPQIHFEFKRGYTPEELKASELRKRFLKQYVIDFDTNLYKTQEERDWAYIAKRYKQP